MIEGWAHEGTKALRQKGISTPPLKLLFLRFLRLAIVLDVLLHIQVFDSLLPPFRRGFALQVMVEELQHASAIVLTVGTLSESVILALVLKHHDSFA